MGEVLDQVRTAIEASEFTRYRIARETGIPEPQLCRLMAGQSGLSIDSLERLAEFLDLQIIIEPKATKRRKK